MYHVHNAQMVNKQTVIMFSSRSHMHMLTCFWFTVFKTEYLSIMSFYFENLLHAGKVMDPVDNTQILFLGVEWRWPELNHTYQRALGIKLCTIHFNIFVPPQHPIAISRCQVLAVWTNTDGPDACPHLYLSIPWSVCIDSRFTLLIQ